MEFLVIALVYLAALVCLAALGWLLVSPFVVFSLWNRVNEMEQRIVRLQKQASLQTEPTREPPVIPATTTAAYETPQVRAAAKSLAGSARKTETRSSRSASPRALFSWMRKRS